MATTEGAAWADSQGRDGADAMIAVGDVVTIRRPAGEYKGIGDDRPRLHASYVVVADPTEVTEVRPSNRHRPEGWLVLLTGLAYPSAWATVHYPGPVAGA